MAPHSSTLAWKNPMDGGAWWVAVHRVTKSRTRLSDFAFTFHFHVLEKEMATYSSVLAWRIPGTGEPGELLSMRSHRVGHDWSDLAAAAASPFSWWCYLTISSSDALFSFCFQSFPASGLFQWEGSSHQLAKVLELQLLYQSFQFCGLLIEMHNMDFIMRKYQINTDCRTLYKITNW